MRQVLDAKDLTTNEKIYFKGHAKATYLSDGRNVEEAINESPIFEAIYGETTYEEIIAAYNAGKVVVCKKESNSAYLVSVSTSVNFVSYAGQMIYHYQCTSASKWAWSTHSVGHTLTTLDNGNVKITIAGKNSEVVTPTYLENLLGTIINGDY